MSIEADATMTNVSWRELDNNPATTQIAAAEGNLYQLHNDGTIWGAGPLPLVAALIQVGIQPVGVAVAPDGSRVYVTNPGLGFATPGTVSVIDTSTNAVVTTVPLETNPIGSGLQTSSVAVAPDGQYLYVTNVISNTVSVINTTTNTVVSTILADGYPAGVAVAPDGSHVYVANQRQFTGTVLVIDV